MPKLLKLVEKTDPILREVMPAVEDFNDPELHQIIEDMRYSILPSQIKGATDEDGAAGMAANQWGIKKRLFVFTPDAVVEGEKPEIMINPSYIPHLRPDETQYKVVAGYEGCFSVPLALGKIDRYDSILATYYTPAGEKVERVMEGWEARVFQHETDHLDGKLFDGRLDQHAGPNCLERHTFKDKQEQHAFIDELRANLSKMDEQH